MFRHTTERGSSRRRATTAALVVVTIPVLIGMAALTVDVAVMYNTRTDLQRSADAAALAGASSLLSDAMLRMRMGTDGPSDAENVAALADVRAAAFGALNPSLGTDTTIVDLEDVQIGYLDLTSGTSPLITNPGPPLYLNAVGVTVRRTAAGPNGAVGFFFAPIFGKMSTDVTATAVAAFDTRVEAYDMSAGYLLPFTIDEENYEAELALGIDNFAHDESNDTTGPGRDGISEANLYPIISGPGNFGLLNIPHTSAQSQTDVERQILNGVSPEELIQEMGTPEFVFEDENGEPIIHTLEGTTGLEASLKAALDLRVGDVIGFLLHDADGVVDTGANLTYPVHALRFARVLEVKLTGNDKRIWIQPATYTGGGLRLRSTGHGSLHDTAGLIVLVR
jgi:hypothetical protein